MTSKGVNIARMINLMRVFRFDERKNLLSVDEELILCYIHERENEGRCTTVTDIVVNRIVGTTPTVQRKVDALTGKGFLSLSRDSKDLRKICLVLAVEAKDYLESMFDYLNPGLIEIK